MKPIPRRVLRSAGLILVQLAVVFVGVYAAFLLDRRQESNRKSARMEQITHVLGSEVASVAFGMRRQTAQFDSVYYAPLVRWYRGDRSDLPLPIPYYMLLGDLRTPELEAILSAGGLDAVSPELLRALRRYNQAVGNLLVVAGNLHRMSIDRIAPRLGAGEDAFFEADGRFREEFAWYPTTILQMRDGMAALADAAAVLAEQLGAQD